MVMTFTLLTDLVWISAAWTGWLTPRRQANMPRRDQDKQRPTAIDGLILSSHIRIHVKYRIQML